MGDLGYTGTATVPDLGQPGDLHLAANPQWFSSQELNSPETWVFFWVYCAFLTQEDLPVATKLQEWIVLNYCLVGIHGDLVSGAARLSGGYHGSRQSRPDGVSLAQS